MISLTVTIPKFPIFLFRINPRKRSNLTPQNMSWACKKCTFINSPSAKSSCNICFSSPPSSPNLASSSAPTNSAAQWSCKACTFLNLYLTPNCQVCDTRRPVLTSASIKELISIDDDELDSSVGSVFLPLRACKRLKTNAFAEKSDGFSQIEAIDEAKIVSLDEDSEKEAVTVTLKIMSYNVWFREDLEVHARMRAIGDLIQLHSPDIICLQEVTPDIYELFRSHPWWRGYRCSVSATEAQLRGYFCMQLSKLQGTTFSCKPFGFSAMGRELCVAEAETQTGQSIIVATSHLESPCPAPPKWDQMFSKERVQQAKEAINFLKNYPNAVFCGDMNWDDKLDGPFPVQENWVDAWTELRPGENGWTYDTKTNKMLSGNRTLQKRLDRFLCCFRDFKITDISMIGMEALPDLSYVKEKKVKSETKQLVLPVLPSDHYGLLLTVTSR